VVWPAEKGPGAEKQLNGCLPQSTEYYERSAKDYYWRKTLYEIGCLANGYISRSNVLQYHLELFPFAKVTLRHRNCGEKKPIQTFLSS
jgi:hypothetical protein